VRTRWIAALCLAALCLAGALHGAPATAQTFVDVEKDGLIAVVGQPPQDGDLASEADLEAVLIAQRQRSEIEAYAAAFDGELSPLAWAMQALGRGYTPQTYPDSFALFDAVRADMSKAVDVIKEKGPQRKRPHQQDSRVTPSLSVSEHQSNSWPSGRAAATRVWAGVLADLFPERKAALVRAADRSAALRLIGGVHYPTDLAAGRRLADAFLARLRTQPLYQQKLAQARKARSSAPGQ
jgi:acid phosphatase (class A)